MSNTSDHHGNTPGERLFVALQYLLPHHLLSALMHRITRCEWTPFKNWVIRRVVSLYRVDMSQAAEPVPEAYRSFNHFFTRALKADARPIAADDLIACPADGAVSQAGHIREGRIFQAKGHDYSLLELLGGDGRLAQEFAEGSFATVYLSPRDYHRVHMPLAGRLREMIHVPGRLFSVNATTARLVPRLFARNERVVNVFDTELGPMAVILVGAIFVSSMDTVWAGTITPRRQRPSRWQYQNEKQVSLAKGEEMGRFNMGSTVILLFGSDAVEWQDVLQPGAELRMGQPIGGPVSAAAPALSEDEAADADGD